MLQGYVVEYRVAHTLQESIDILEKMKERIFFIFVVTSVTTNRSENESMIEKEKEKKKTLYSQIVAPSFLSTCV